MSQRDMDRRLKLIINELKSKGIQFNNIYDIGSNDGRWTKKEGIGLFGKDANYWQFEANKNCPQRHKGSWIKARHIAVLSDEDGKEVKMWLPDESRTENTGYSYYQENTIGYGKGKYETSTTIKLDTLVAEHGMPKPDFVKMDTQGSEVDIIRGGSILKHAVAIHCEVPIFEYNKGAPKLSEYIDCLDELGFLMSGVSHIAIKRGVVSQMDVTFVRKDVLKDVYKPQVRMQF